MAKLHSSELSELSILALLSLGQHSHTYQLQANLKALGSPENYLNVARAAAQRGWIQLENPYIHWDAVQLHQCLMQWVDHPHLKVAAKAASAWGRGDPGALRIAIYQNRVERFDATTVFYIREMLDSFDSVSGAWLAQRQPEVQSLLLDHLGPRRLYFADLDKDWQNLLSQEPNWRFALALMRGDREAARQWAAQKGEQETLWLLEGDAERAHAGFRRYVKKRAQPVFPPLPALFAQLAALRVGDAQSALEPQYSCPLFPRIQEMFSLVCQRVILPKARLPFPSTYASGLHLAFAKVLEPLLPEEARPPEVETEAARSKWQQHGLAGLLQTLSPPDHPTHWGYGLGLKSAWESWLTALRARADSVQVTAPKSSTAKYRLAWALLSNEVSPIKQKETRNGWSASKISWQTLLSKPPDFLSEQDRVVIGKVRQVKNSWESFLEFGPEVFSALVGHPHLEFGGKPCSLELVPLALSVEQRKNGWLLTTKPPVRDGMTHVIFQIKPGRMGLSLVTDSQRPLIRLLEGAVEVPSSAREQLLESMQAWRDKVALDLPRELVPQITAQSQCGVRLTPYQEGLRLEVGIHPVAGHPLWVTPGEGASQVTLKRDGTIVSVHRSLEAEKSSLAQIGKICPELDGLTLAEIEDPAAALEVLLQLQNAGVPLEWPQGKSWKIQSVDQQHRLSLSAFASGEWFEVRGELTLDENVKLDVSKLLELARQSRSRFVTLGEGQFLALTQDLRQRLSALDDLVEVNKKKVRLNRLAVSALAEMGVEGDEAFQKSLAQFAQAESYTARLPGALQAELRDYQIEGFRWLARRARAGAGSCLADDMGLGKTLQVLALLLKEAKAGPHLVVCPTSVCSNWLSQARRFAPGLQVVHLEGKQRAAQLQQLGNGCLALCSYRILQQDIELLEAVSFNAVVLDEAQFIKNPESKTAKAAFRLKASIRVVTTGTPIENRLQELWSQFNFLNPGLLGSQSHFQRRFEGATAGSARQRLRRLVAPFLLRRTKSQVLEELPPRTDIQLDVELSAQERALYETLRAEALDSANQEQGHLQILAHLTRLRQACCHPQLLQVGLPSSKFETFFALAEELKAGRHRALIFSQFVELLQLLRQEMEQRDWSYLYLDGSTPANQRPQLVENFQQGEHDFFLISLKAGGTGLNLTAADYVVHLDPWWNPAAEDQASDRAHRIGQTRPVTVYRLVARDTLEERVLQLHSHKRELAQSVLEGAETPTRLNTQELLELLRG